MRSTFRPILIDVLLAALQAGLARYVLDADPPTARAAISTAADAGRQALAEMRRLLDVLRVDQGPDVEAASGYRPQPGLSDLDELVDRTRTAGLPVEVVVTGRARPLAPGPDLCAYRVAQESLTNILKHAGPARARIEIDYDEPTFTLSVSDDGAAPAPGPRRRVRTESAACGSVPSCTAVSSAQARGRRAGSP